MQISPFLFKIRSYLNLYTDFRSVDA